MVVYCDRPNERSVGVGYSWRVGSDFVALVALVCVCVRFRW